MFFYLSNLKPSVALYFCLAISTDFRTKFVLKFSRQHFFVNRPGKRSPSFLSFIIIVGAFGNLSFFIQFYLPCFCCRSALIFPVAMFLIFSCTLNRYGKTNPARNRHSGLPRCGRALPMFSSLNCEYSFTTDFPIFGGWSITKSLKPF